MTNTVFLNSIHAELDRLSMLLKNAEKREDMLDDLAREKWVKVENMEAAPAESYTQAECDRIYDEYDLADKTHRKAEDEIDEIEDAIAKLKELKEIYEEN